MAIEAARDEEDAEPHAATALDDFFKTPYTAYDVLHSLIHQAGTVITEEGIKKALEEAPKGVMISLPPVHIPISLLSEALERFKATHSEEELKEAAKGAQEYFGGRLRDVLGAIIGGEVVGVELSPEEPPEAPPTRKKLH